MCVQYGGRGLPVSCRARRRVNMTKTRKSMVRKKEKTTTTKRVAKKKHFFFMMVLGRIDPWHRPRRFWEPPFEPQVPPERLYLTDHWTPSPIYRNLVITRVCTNNKIAVLLIVLLYCYSSTLPDDAVWVESCCRNSCRSRSESVVSSISNSRSFCMSRRNTNSSNNLS